MLSKAARLAARKRRQISAPPHAVAHHQRGIGLRFAKLMKSGRGAWLAFLAVLGPGLLAGLSDDDPAGITTYSVLGADFGYRLLWIIPASTILLVQFHLMAVRLGAATGKGFVGVIRDKWGRGAGYFAVCGLLFANFGTICEEYAGISAAGGLVGIPSWISAPVAGVLISLVVVLGSYHRVERVLLVISASLAGWVAIAAALGTTLAPWGLAFIQSYAVDKKITLETLRWARVDVVIGSVLTGVIGLAIAVACAATLNKAGIHIADAGDAAKALQPLAGRFATVFFGAGLLGASLLAAAIVPIATAYSIAEGVGQPASLDLDSHHFQWFYAAFIGLTIASVSVVSLPGLPLIPLIFMSQVVNAVLLPLHVIALQLLAGNAAIMGTARQGPWSRAAGWGSIALILACIGALVGSWLG